MKHTHRCLTLAVCLLLLFSWVLPCAPVSADARSGSLTETITWNLSDDGVLTVSGTGEMPDYNYLSHRGEVISPPWSEWKSEIKEILIGEGITRIGDYTFCYYTSVTEASEYTSLQKIVFPSTLRSVGSDAFFCHYYNEDVNPTLHVPSLKDWCEIRFDTEGTCMDFSVNQFASPVWTTGVPYIDGKQPSGKIVFPASLTEVQPCTFDNWAGITEIVLHDGITEIGELAFSTTKIKTITLPEGISDIKMGTFSGCYELTEIDLPDSVQSIGHDAFYACKKLTEITLPTSLRFIGTDAFALCNTLSKVHITDLASYLHVYQGDPFQGGHLLEGNAKTSRTLYLNGEKLTEIVIPSEIKVIPPYAFYGCDTLTKVTFKDSFELIGERAFDGCTALTAVEQVISIDTVRNVSGYVVQQYAFSGCKSLKNIPTVYDHIGAKAFADCASLTDIELWADYVEPAAFEGCTSLRSAAINRSNLLDNASDPAHSLSSLLEVKLWSIDPTDAFSERYTEIAKEGNFTVYSRCEHDWKPEDGFDGCIFDGVCTHCGRTKEHITNHTAGEWTTVTEPTETAVGEKQIACTVCGEVLERETIDMLEKTEESSQTVSEETSEEISEETGEEASEETSIETSHASASSAPTESTAPDTQKGGVPVWAVVLIALCAAACGVGGTYLIIKKK